MNAPRLLVAYGTRPEQIKLTPVADALRASGARVKWWSTGQSGQFVPSVSGVGWTGGLVEGAAQAMRHTHEELSREPYDAVVVQGDTASAWAVAQAAWLAQVPVAHVEAGLRTYRAEPWPEEGFRRQIGAIATWHFCPDEDAANNLSHELGGFGLDRPRGIFVVGNPIADVVPPAPLLVLVTLHRRENWGPRIESALDVLNRFALQHETALVEVVRHPNWKNWCRDPWAWEHLQVLEPMPHDDLLDTVRAAHLVVTDSGGLQEEAALLGTDCWVWRTATERVALEREGAVRVFHPDEPHKLAAGLEQLVARRVAYGRRGVSAEIARLLLEQLAQAGAALVA